MLDQNVLQLHDSIIDEADPLKLELDDADFVEVINNRISDSISYYKDKNLYERQDRNVDYYLGHQIDTIRQVSYQKPYVENVIYESIRRIKPIAISRLPDLTVKPGNNDPQTKKYAETLTDMFNTNINRRSTRKLLGIAHVQEQLWFYAVVKARWNPELGTDGNFEFLNVHPQNAVWDQTCKTNNVDDMTFFAENAELTVKEAIMMFPKSKEDLLNALGFEEGDDQNEKKLASRIKIWEVWFHWYKSVIDPQSGEHRWEKISAVVWKYQSVVLGKMRNPYFDFEGKINLFTAEMKEKGMPSEDDLYNMLFGSSEPTETDKIYYNYFKNPRKPYFLMVYEPLGSDPIDSTNRVEQILLFQDHINKEGDQIIGMNERSAGKPVFNVGAIDKDTVKKIDWHNYRQALTVKGDDITKAFTTVAMPAAPAQLYQSKSENRSIAFEMMGVGATTRGVQQADSTLGESQMFREADYGFIDDLVEETINELAEWIAQWSMQFIRLFYTKAHMVDMVGIDGESLYEAINQDIVQDGMVVEVSASGVDKMMRKRMAIQNMQMQVGDILSYYEDTDQSNPKERALRAWMYKYAPQMYMQKYLMTEAPTAQPGATGIPPATPPPTGTDPNAAAPMMDAMPPAPGAPPTTGVMPPQQ